MDPDKVNERILEWAAEVDRYHETVCTALIRKHGPVQAINAMKNGRINWPTTSTNVG
jgi:hypothetical protein